MKEENDLLGVVPGIESDNLKTTKDYPIKIPLSSLPSILIGGRNEKSIRNH